MRKFLFLIFVFLSFFTVGCSGTTSDLLNPEDAPVYNVYADDVFSTNHQIDIAAALQEWNTKTNNVMQYQLHFVDQSQLGTDQTPNTIYIYAKDPNPPGATDVLGWTYWTDGTNGAYMHIVPGVIDDRLFTAILLHELGHAFHLAHYTEPNLSIMHPVIYTDTWHVECTDVQQFCGIWNCTTDCMVVPEQDSDAGDSGGMSKMQIKFETNNNSERIILSQ